MPDYNDLLLEEIYIPSILKNIYTYFIKARNLETFNVYLFI